MKSLSEQYQRMTEILLEILRLYSYVLFAFAIALFSVATLLKAGSNGETIIEISYIISPYLIISWLVGYLFLFWNYTLVIMKMDCIARMLTKHIEPKLEEEEAKLLSYQQFQEIFSGNKLILLIYAIIAFPVILVYIYLATESCIRSGKLFCDLAEWINGFLLIALPFFCLGFHQRVFVRNRDKRLEELKKDGLIWD